MNTHADKTFENKSRAVASSLTKQKKNNESIFQLIDNRPEVIAKKKLQENINHSPRVQQLKSFLDMTNNFNSQTLQKKESKTSPVVQLMRNKDISGALYDVRRNTNITFPEDALRILKQHFDNIDMTKQHLSGILTQYNGEEDFQTFINSKVPSPIAAMADVPVAIAEAPVTKEYEDEISAIESVGFEKIDDLKKHFQIKIVGVSKREELMKALTKLKTSNPELVVQIDVLLKKIQETHFSESHALQDQSSSEGWMKLSTK